MTNKIPGNHRAALLIRRVARIWSIPALLFIGVMVVGEVVSPHAPPTASVRNIIGLVLFPFGVCLGILMAWRWESLGSIISVSSFLGFYATLWFFDGRLPRGPFFALVAAPGFLFLVSALLDRGIQQPKESKT